MQALTEEERSVYVEKADEILGKALYCGSKYDIIIIKDLNCFFLFHQERNGPQKNMAKALSRREKKTFFLTVLLFFAVLAVFVAVRSFIAGGNHIITTSLAYTTARDSVVAEGIVIRSDKLISASQNDLTLMLVKDGEKVAKSDKLAVSFSAKSHMEEYQNGIALQATADNWRRILSQSVGTFDISNVNASLYESLLSLSADNAVARADGSHTQSALDAIVTRAHVLGADDAISAHIKELDAESSRLLSAAGTPRYISTSFAGYFSFATDGLEDSLSFSKAESITADQVEEKLDEPLSLSSDRHLGRVVTGYQWYYAAMIPSVNAELMNIGAEYSLTFPSFSVKGVLKKTEFSSAGNLLCVFLVSEKIQNIVSERKLDGEIVFNNYEGYQVPKSCVRIETNEVGEKVLGVFVIRGRRCVFMTIDILLEKENYYIVKADLSDNSGLYLNDTLVLSGKNLYDGMVIN